MAKRKIVFLITAITLLLVSTVSFSIAQYFDKQNKNNLANSEQFFFSLDVADNSTSDAPYYLLSNQINIKVSNNNGSEINSANIAYSVKVENSDGTDITNSLTITGNDGSLTGGEISTDNISVSGISEDTLYIVKISSTSPYTKTLSAKFMLKSVDDSYYIITDNGNYITLELYIGNSVPTNNLTIDYGVNLAPDNTNTLMEDWINATSGTILPTSLSRNNIYTFIFFEQNTLGNYTKAKTSIDLTSSQIINIISN